MSKWYEPKEEDIDIYKDEIHIYLDSDENGAIYCSLKVEDMKDLIHNFERGPNPDPIQ